MSEYLLLLDLILSEMEEKPSPLTLVLTLVSTIVFIRWIN